LTSYLRVATSRHITALAGAFALYLVWVLATWLLEGLPRTLLRPEATSLRLAYALVANVAIGLALPLWLLRRWVRSGRASALDLGFSGRRRTVLSVVAAAGVGYALFRLNATQPVSAVVLANAFAQVWVVSLAEILVCWGLVGSAALLWLRPRRRVGAFLLAAVLASVFFGVYHFAHSPPFNEPGMVVFLSVIGLATSAWWLASRDVFGTAVFHAFFALTGVLAALEDRAPGANPELSVPLLTTAAVTLVLLALGARWIRS
jgi:hypothetical protein